MRKKKVEAGVKYEPLRCWVGEQQKVVYETREDAEMAARWMEGEFGLEAGRLTVYRCEYADHWHVANGK